MIRLWFNNKGWGEGPRGLPELVKIIWLTKNINISFQLSWFSLTFWAQVNILLLQSSFYLSEILKDSGKKYIGNQQRYSVIKLEQKWVEFCMKISRQSYNYFVLGQLLPNMEKKLSLSDIFIIMSFIIDMVCQYLGDRKSSTYINIIFQIISTIL